MLSIFSLPAACKQMSRELHKSFIINSRLMTTSGLSLVLSSSITFLCSTCSSIWSNFHAKQTLSYLWSLSLYHLSRPNHNQIFMIYLLNIFQISLLFSVSNIATFVQAPMISHQGHCHRRVSHLLQTILHLQSAYFFQNVNPSLSVKFKEKELIKEGTHQMKMWAGYTFVWNPSMVSYFS